ncbi:integral membrane protein protein, putative [Babesia ovis]|uniref:Integral membrane protein protein, putative n=1 Tax=Babesia ovis TaxID=5869 RepID=A0A9W5WTD3_BABOV|nr:integral membrane protein protein, putative [Babesia ovis]
MDEANRFSKTVVIQDTQDISVETARNKSVLNSTINLPCLILVGLNVLLSVLIMILCFKDSENGSSIETVQNIINTPITTASNHTVFTIGNDLPEMTLRAQVKSKDDSIFIHQAKSTEDIKQWLKGVLSKIHIFNHLCILTDRSNNANAKKVDLAIVDEIFKGQELNDFSFLFMLETSDSELVYFKIDDIVGFKLFVKSVEEHKNYLENTDDEVDYCKDFFHRFPRDVPKGVTALNPRMQVHNYLERIKKYLLCTLFLRMKVRTLSSKIESVEKRTIERMPSNEYRRQYITMLKQRLQRTVVAIEKFKVQMEMLIRDHEANLVEISDVFNATMDGMNSDMSLEGFDSDKLTVDVTRLEKFILPPLHLSHISNPSGQSETFLKGTTEFSKCQSSVVENKMTDETRFSSPKKEGAESHREEEVHVSGKTVDSKEAAELPLSKGVGSPSQESVSHGSTNDDLTHSAGNQMSSKLDKEDKTHGDRRVVSSLGDGHKGQKFDDRNATTTGKQNNHGVGLKPSTNEKGRSLDDDLNDTLNTKNTCDITGRRRNQENTESDAMAQITDGDENTPPDVDDVGIFKTSVFGKR